MMTPQIRKILGRRTSKAVIILTAVFAVYSCKDSFLEIPPTGALNDTQLASTKGLDGLLVGVYAQINGRGTRMASASNWVWGSIRGGDANKGTNSGDYSDINPVMRFETIPTSVVVADKWNGLFEGVARANTVLRIMKQAGSAVPTADQTRIMSETRFLRGHFYFELKREFNNVPYVDETVDYGSGIEKVPNNVDIWPKIEADLKYAYDNLPETQASVGRVNKWAAASYLAKAYMYQSKFNEAKALYDLITANGRTSNGKKYNLVARYADVFKASNDNHEESVFAFQAAANTGNVNNANPEFDLNFPYNTGAAGPGNCCGFFQPSFEMANSFRTDAKGLPLLDGSYNNTGNELKTDMGLESNQAFTPDAGNVDPRLDHSVGRRGIPYLDWQNFPGKDWIRDQPYGGPYATKKYVYYKSDVGSLQDNSSWTPGYSAINYTVIRYADVLLMAAEAEIEVGSLEKARTYVNQVRTRAANSAGFVKTSAGADAAKYVISTYDTPWTDKAVARTAVRFERKLELSGEGHRFFDLVRWKTVNTDVNAYLTYEGRKLPSALGSAKFTPNKFEYSPLPQGQIDLQGKEVLKQNNGY